MSLDIKRYTRAPFAVLAAKVTDENMAAVAEWCQGEIVEPTPDSEGKSDTRHIKVNVQRPFNDRQTKAFVDDYVTLSDTGGFKVFTPNAFEKGFNLEEEVLAQAEPPVVANPQPVEIIEEVIMTPEQLKAEMDRISQKPVEADPNKQEPNVEQVTTPEQIVEEMPHLLPPESVQELAPIDTTQSNSGDNDVLDIMTGGSKTSSDQ